MWKNAASALLVIVLACGGGGEGSAGDGAGGAKVATKVQEIRTQMRSATGALDNLIIKGELPEWKFDGSSRLERREKVNTKALGEAEIVVMDLEFGSWGGTGMGEADFKKEMERTRDGIVGKTVAGEPVKLEKDVSELEPKVWSFVTKAKDFAEGSAYEIYVYHFDATLPLMHRCKGQARVTFADQWKEIERICSGVSIELSPAMRKMQGY